MSDMEAEVEEISFLPGEKILNKKAVYEPSSSQRCRQLVCTKRWAVSLLVIMALFIVLIALIAAFARPGSLICQALAPEPSGNASKASSSSETPSSDSETYLSTDGRHFPWHDVRLPRTVIPESYEIFLHPNLTASTFEGRVRMKCRVASATKDMVFHVKDLEVTEVKVLRGEVGVEVVERMEYKGNQQYYVMVRRPLAADSQITVVVEFHAPLVEKLGGFYKSSYQTTSGEKRVIATTHFESTDARAAFPCFDEPDLKANFSLSIVRDPGHITLFNMPLDNTSPYGDGLLLDKYQTSVKMSTYLVAFVVCDFKNVSANTTDGTLVRVFAPEDQISQAVYARDVAVKVLNYYNQFFGVKFPLPKQDMIAIPDFAAGAMENWGLITYRMTSILYDPEKTSDFSKQWILITIAHELAHQWFGDIVTMKWWDDLWLNEGFAAFVEYLGSDIAEPEFGMKDQFVYETQQKALNLDAYSSSHPVQVTVTNPAQINEIFDSISYDKGASLINMLQGILGDDSFQKGLKRYLKKHAYGNAQTADLWNALQEESNLTGMTVKDVMDTWTLQMGYPVINVKRSPATGHLTLSQSRFLMTQPSAEVPEKFKSPYNYTWKVPFTFVTKSNPTQQQLHWLTEAEMTLDVDIPTTDWVKGNVNNRGFYRVNYEPSLWRQIIQQIKDGRDVFSTADRSGLIDDAFALARAGLLDYDIAFELATTFQQETSYVALCTYLTNMGFIRSRLYLTEAYPQFIKFQMHMAGNLSRELGWKNQTKHLDRLLQSSLAGAMLALDDAASVTHAQQLFAGNWSLIPKNLKKLVWNAGVKYGNDSTWKRVFDEFTASDVPTEKRALLSALTFTRDVRRIQLFLQDSLNSSIIRPQDADTVMKQLAESHEAHIFVWRFLQKNWDTIFKRYYDTPFILTGIFNRVVSPFNTQFDYDEVSAFFKDKDVASGAMGLKQSLEKVKTHIAWDAKYRAKVVRWFKSWTPTA